MIKAIHKMMRKKGFTLVELIIVLAIVGVLAAVLVPTLIGVVTKSRVASANSTAAEIRRVLNNFMVDAEVDGFCMKQSSGMSEVFDVTVNGGVWECSSASDTSHFNKRNGTDIEWGNGGAASRGKAGDPRTGITSGEKYMCVWLADRFPDMTDASMIIAFNGGGCTFTAFTPEKSTALDSTEHPAITGGYPCMTFGWNGSHAGITSTGLIVGTSPVIELA